MNTSTSYHRTTAHPWEAPGVLADWCTDMRAENLAERTVTERPRIVTRAAEALGVDPTTFTDAQLATWLAGLTTADGTGRTASAGTRATYYGALRAWHAWLILKGYRTDNPMAKLRTPKVPRRLPRPVHTRDLQAVLDSRMHRRTRVMVHLAAYQGLRAHEIAKVRGEDFNLGAGTLRVIGKGGSDDVVPLHPVVAHDAGTMPRIGWWFPSPAGDGPVRRDSISAILSRAIKRAGVQGTGHQLRHWYGTELVESGTDVRVVQTLMRHESLATTALYTAVSERKQRDALARLPLLTDRGIA